MTGFDPGGETRANCRESTTAGHLEETDKANHKIQPCLPRMTERSIVLGTHIISFTEILTVIQGQVTADFASLEIHKLPCSAGI